MHFRIWSNGDFQDEHEIFPLFLTILAGDFQTILIIAPDPTPWRPAQFLIPHMAVASSRSATSCTSSIKMNAQLLYKAISLAVVMRVFLGRAPLMIC